MNRVLIVDDDPDIREIVSLVLRIHGYDVVEAKDGSEALAKLHNGDGISLVLLDMMMPGVTGADVLAEMRHDSELSHIPVIIISGDRCADDCGANLGASGCLLKPVDLDRLLGEIRRFLPPETAAHA